MLWMQSRRGRTGGQGRVASRILDETVLGPGEDGESVLSSSPGAVRASKQAVTRSTGVLHVADGSLGGTFGASGGVFDASRALSVLENLSNTSELEGEAGKMLDALDRKLSELRELKTTSAERSLEEFRRSVSQRDASMTSGVAALREELEATRLRAERAEAALKELREHPPAPSEEMIRDSTVFREEAEARERAERRAELADREARQLRDERSSLVEGFSTGNGRASGARAALAREVRSVNDRLENMQNMLARLTGMVCEQDDESGLVWNITVPLDDADEDAQFELEIIPGEDGENAVEVRPVAHKEMLPEFLQDAISFDEGETTKFLQQFLSEMLPEAEEEA
jgi:hypothetical protein